MVSPMARADHSAPEPPRACTVINVFAAQELPHQGFVERELGLEVKAVDGLGHGELRLLDPPLGGAPLPINQLPLDQAQEVLRITAALLAAALPGTSLTPLLPRAARCLPHLRVSGRDEGTVREPSVSFAQ